MIVAKPYRVHVLPAAIRQLFKGRVKCKVTLWHQSLSSILNNYNTSGQRLEENGQTLNLQLNHFDRLLSNKLRL